MIVINPPPQKIPSEYQRVPGIRDYETRQKEVLRLMFDRLTNNGSLAPIIKVKTGTYQVLQNDDIINCTGAFTVTFINIADAKKPITISSTSATITLSADATIEAGTVTSGNSTTFYPAGGQWWIR